MSASRIHSVCFGFCILALAAGGAWAGVPTDTPTATPTQTVSPTPSPSPSSSPAGPQVDFGDAPDPLFKTLLVNNGARHTINSLFIGTGVDGEPDGQPTADATGDDANGAGEDGLIFLTTLMPGAPASLQVEASAAGLFSAWIDFNGDGDWIDANEQIFFSRMLNPGTNALLFAVSGLSTPGFRIGRFRLTTFSPVDSFGLAPNGEVEDVQLEIVLPTPTPTATPTPALIFNEIHADPVAGLAGDANADGIGSALQDEFIEIVNVGADDVDLSDFLLSDGTGVRHVFPAGTLAAAGCSVVVFGGGTPAGEFGFSLVQTASSGSLDLNNTFETVTLLDPIGSTTIATYTYGAEANADQSITRSPDATGGEPLVQHLTAAGAGSRRFSPGTRVNGTMFGGCLTPSPTPSVTPTSSLTPSISATPTESLTPSMTPSESPSPSETPSLTPTISPSFTPSLTPSISLTPSLTPLPPVIIQHPYNQVANVEQKIEFNVVAQSSVPVTYQWLKNDEPIPGAVAATFTLPGVSTLDDGSYAADVTNETGTVRSNPGTLSVFNPSRPNNADFISTTLPTTMFTNQGLFAGFLFANNSEISWSVPQAYSLAVIFDPGNLFQGIGRFGYFDPTTVVPPNNGLYQFVAFVQAPATPGVYTFQVRLVEELVEFFGELVEIDITVIDQPNNASDWILYE